MGNMDTGINLDITPNYGIAQRPPVDSDIGAYFGIVPYVHASKLWEAHQVSICIAHKAKAIIAYHSARLDTHIVSNRYARSYYCIRPDVAVSADLRTILDNGC